MTVDHQRTTAASARLNLVQARGILAHGDVQIAGRRSATAIEQNGAFRRFANVKQRQRLTAIQALAEIA